MGVRFECPNGHKLHVKAHLAGQRGICPHCDSRFIVPAQSGDPVHPPDEPEPIDIPTNPEEAKSEEAKSVEPSVEAIDTKIAPKKPHRTSRRGRQERARRLTLILAAVIFVLAIALVLTLRQ